MKEINSGWEQILYYDTRRMEGMEEEMKLYLPELLSKTHSLRLTLIIQKYLIFIDQHLTQLNLVVKEGGIGSLLQQNSIVTQIWRDLREKINYCNEAQETDHCILSTLLMMAQIKHHLYEQSLSLSKKLKLDTTTRRLQEVMENEKKIEEWLVELRNSDALTGQTPASSSGVSSRQAYWLL